MLTIIAGGLGLLAAVVILIDAFKNSTLDGVLCLFLPFYSLYYVIVKQQEHKGVVVMLLIASIGAGAASHTDLFNHNDPCQKLDRSQVGLIFGEVFRDPENRTNENEGACVYETTIEPKKQLGVFMMRECSASRIAEMSQDDVNGRFKVHDLGDAAMSRGPELWVQKGNSCVMVIYKDGERDYLTSLPARKRLASMVLAKMD